jgi:glycosyltransferase involved in cell wall biosynthesis
MKITILSHNLSSNASMRAHRLALAAQHFAEVKLIGPVESSGLWPALPAADWIHSVPECRFPKFASSFVQLAEMCDGDVLIAVKPQLGSFGAALVAAERWPKPVILDLDDLDTAFSPREEWESKPGMADLHRPASAVFVSLLTRATGAAQAITVSSTALQKRFGGTVLHQGCDTRLFDPTRIDREAARREFGFKGPTILFVGTPRWHKGMKPLAKAVAEIPGARLAVASRDKEFAEGDWSRYPVDPVPMLPYTDVPRLIAAADVLAIPQLDTEVSHFQMPMKAYDCMAMGVPIVASAISDLPQLLDGCARLVPPGDVAVLAGALRETLEQPEASRAMAAKARARCLENYTMAHVGATLREVINKVAPGLK